MSFVSPQQLQPIFEKVRDAIRDGATDLSPYAAILRDPITFDQLNAGDYIKKVNLLGLRVVKSSSSIKGISIQFFCVAYATELYIGLTNSVGEVDNLEDATVQGYEKQPGLSIAIRYNVITNFLLDKTVVTSNGISKWHVMPIANFTGFLLGAGGAAGDSCSCKTWKGTQSEYDAITSKDPDTIYYITES